MSTLPPVFESVNPQPGFYAVIPAPVRYCRDLPASAKLLYGEITALCAVEGYCWASNSYFCSLYDVDDRTVRRWLAALTKHGFIKATVTGPKRRIYLAEAAPKQAKRRAKMSGLGGQKCPGKPDKNVPHSITLNNTKNITSEDVRGGARFVGPGPVAARDLAALENVPPKIKSDCNGSASPPTVEAPPAVRQVERVVAACRDHAARGRISELWEIVQRSGCVDVWPCGLDAIKSPSSPSTGILEAPAAIFCRVVVLALAERGVLVPSSLR